MSNLARIFVVRIVVLPRARYMYFLAWSDYIRAHSPYLRKAPGRPVP